MSTEFTTPVALFIFNRLETTGRVFDVIRIIKPRKLLIVADGPREERPGEAEKCRKTRGIIDRIDWPCEVLKNFSNVNLGCKKRVSSGLDWVFDTVEEAIILEDDCLPHPTFFQFCSELLEKYRFDSRIALIGGVNYQFGRKRTAQSYYFSRFNHISGWASWRRAWSHYDVNLSSWPQVRKDNWLYDILGNNKLARKWTRTFDNVYHGMVDTWDFQWTYACWINNALSILPNVNLVSNIGYAHDATHTQDAASKIANMAVEEMQFPLTHPDFMIRDSEADDLTQRLVFEKSVIRSVIHKISPFFRIRP